VKQAVEVLFSHFDCVYISYVFSSDTYSMIETQAPG